MLLVKRIIPFFLAAAINVNAQVDLGTALSFGVLGSSTVTNTGPTTIEGDVGVSPGTAITGFPPGSVTDGTIHAGDAEAVRAQDDALIAYNQAASQSPGVDLTGQDLGGLRLTPGVYAFSSSAQITGDLILDALGNTDTVWIFQINSTLTTATDSSVILVNGASSCNVFWQVGSSATLGFSTHFIGNILALESITLVTDTTLEGGIYALNGAVTLDTNSIIAPSNCIVSPTSSASLSSSTSLPSSSSVPPPSSSSSTPSSSSISSSLSTTPSSSSSSVPLSSSSIPPSSSSISSSSSTTPSSSSSLSPSSSFSVPSSSSKALSSSSTRPSSSSSTVLSTSTAPSSSFSTTTESLTTAHPSNSSASTSTPTSTQSKLTASLSSTELSSSTIRTSWSNVPSSMSSKTRQSRSVTSMSCNMSMSTVTGVISTTTIFSKVVKIITQTTMITFTVTCSMAPTSISTYNQWFVIETPCTTVLVATVPVGISSTLCPGRMQAPGETYLTYSNQAGTMALTKSTPVGYSPNTICSSPTVLSITHNELNSVTAVVATAVGTATNWANLVFAVSVSLLSILISVF